MVSEWVPNLIWQPYFKLPKICFLYNFCRPNEKTAQIWCFTSTSAFYNILTNGLSIWSIFDWQLKNLWNYLFIITYLIITKTFYLVKSKNLPGELYVSTAPVFSTLPLLILLKMCLLSFQKMSCHQRTFLLQQMLFLSLNWSLLSLIKGDYSNLQHFKKCNSAAGWIIQKL